MAIHGYLGGVISATAPSVTTAGASGVFTLEEQLQAAGQNNWPGYQISRSVRLRASASAYFNRTPATATNQRTWSWSAWVKRGALGTEQMLFEGGIYSGSTEQLRVFFTSTDNLEFNEFSSSAYQFRYVTTAVYRDPSAWYHILAVLDTTNSVGKLYVNGVQVTAFSTSTAPALNFQGKVNSVVAHDIGRRNGIGTPYFDGYLTEINFIDGQALTPASFGAFDAVTGVWNPIRYSGTYGNNGFYLNFSDNTSPPSATTIGKDSSGNGNNWTPTGISLTTGTTYDSMVDVPIGYGSDTGVGGELRGNYCTFNPIDVSTGSTAQTITQGNLTLFSSSSTRIDGAYSTFSAKSGKWYVEITLTTRTNDYPGVGWSSTSFNSTGSGFQYQAGTSSNPSGASIDPFGRLGLNATQSGGSYFGSGGTWAQGDIIQVAVDIDNKLIWFGKAGSWSGTAGNMNGNPATGTNGTSFSAQGGTEFKFQSTVGDSAKGDVNFGQRAFSYTAPSGFKALCTQNLPTPTVNNGANYMAASLYTGTGASQTVSNAVNSISFQPDLVWIKSRSAATNHKLTDSVRGTTKALISNTTGAETTDTNGLTAFGSSGFTVGTDTVYNNSGATYVGWQWKASGSTVSNTAGSITSTVSANTTAGFSIVTYTGTGANATVGHGLGVAPSMIIVKSRSPADWYVGHTSIGWSNTGYLILNNTGASGQYGSVAVWQSTAPTSTIITLGTASGVNASAVTYVAYCFAPITGYSAFGSYTGNGSTDGPFVYTGMRVRWLMIKRSSSASVTYGWQMYDTSRQPYNTASSDPNLWADTSAAEGTGNYTFDLLSNGFKLRSSGVNENASGDTYIYAAFAENPFNISRAR